jgi:spore germination protein YaaH
VANVRRSGYWRATLVAAVMIGLSACNPNRFVSGWVPYWTAPEGRVGFTDPQATTMFSDISPFFFSALPDGTIGLVGSASQLNTTVHEAHIRGLKVMPSITDGSGQWMMATVILANTTSRAQHIANIVSLTDTYPEIDGIDLDYEGFAFADGRSSWASTRPLWVAFVTELAAALHAKGKLLSATIPPTWMAGGVETGYPVYDQAAIAPVVDRVRLMVYDWSVASPGSISPMSWVNQVIAYSNAHVADRSKLQLGVPSYGRNWGRQVYAEEICPDGALKTSSIELQNMPALIAAHGATPTRLDPATLGEMYFSYDVVVTGYSTKPISPPPYVPPTRVIPTVTASASDRLATGLRPALRLTPPTMQLSCTVRHFVYFPDAATIQQHAQAALDAGWSGIIIWALGYETADVYTALANTTP